MTKDDVLFGYRQQLFAEAARTSVSAACRMFGVHRSTYYVWKRQVDRHGLEMLRPRERRRPQMPNQLPKMVEQRIVSFALAHPGLGPRRVASELGREKWGGVVVSANGVWKVLRRHGLNTRSKRLALIAGYAAPYEPPRDPGPGRHIDVERPGGLVGMDCFFVGRLKGTSGAIWQLTAIDIASSFAWAELVVCPSDNPTATQTSKLAKRVARDLKAAGWQLERVVSDNGNEFRSVEFGQPLERLRARHSRIHAGRPQTNGNVEALHKTILDECWRPAFAATSTRATPAYAESSTPTCATTTTTASTTAASPAAKSPADIVYGARKMEARRAAPVGTSRSRPSLSLRAGRAAVLDRGAGTRLATRIDLEVPHAVLLLSAQGDDYGLAKRSGAARRRAYPTNRASRSTRTPAYRAFASA